MKFHIAIAALLIGLFSSLVSQAEPQFADGIKVIVHDSIVTYQQVEQHAAPAIDNLRRQYRTDPQTFQKRFFETLDESTETLVQRAMILREFETAGYSLPESVIDDYVQQRIRRQYPNRASFIKTLQAQGITYEKYRKDLRDQFIVEQMRLKNISDAIIMSPHKIEVYYVTHTNDFRVEEQVKLRMVVLNKSSSEPEQARKLAEEILGKLNEGASFSEMASVYSDSRRGQGGAWDWVEPSVLRKDLADAVASLNRGERSGVIETPEACYIILVEDRRPAHIKPLNDVREEIERILQEQESNRRQKQWNDKLKKKTFVRYFQ